MLPIISTVWHIPEDITVNVLESGGDTGNAQRQEHVSRETVSDLKNAAHLHVFQVLSTTEV